MLVDSSAVCYVGSLAWVRRISPENKQLTSLTSTTGLGELAPIAEDVRDPGPHPARQDAPLVEAVRQPQCPARRARRVVVKRHRTGMDIARRIGSTDSTK